MEEIHKILTLKQRRCILYKFEQTWVSIERVYQDKLEESSFK